MEGILKTVITVLLFNNICTIAIRETNQNSDLATDEDCGKDWKLFHRNCYKLSSINATWENAKKNCQGEGAELALPRNQWENGFMIRMADGRIEYSSIWINANDEKDEDDWVDGHGNRIFYANFGYGMPEGSKEKNAAFMYLPDNWEWHDGKTSDEYAYICMKPAPESTHCKDTYGNCSYFGLPMCVREISKGFVERNCAGFCKICEKDPRCSEPFKFIGGTCYKFVEDKLNWQSADAMCKQDYAYLVQVTDAKQERNLTRYIEEAYPDTLKWRMALTREKVKKKWTPWEWNQGPPGPKRPLGKYSNWKEKVEEQYPDRPNAVLQKSGTAWKWGVVHWGTETAYICERATNHVNKGNIKGADNKGNASSLQASVLSLVISLVFCKLMEHDLKM